MPASTRQDSQGRHLDQMERIAVCRRAHDRFCANIATAARPVLDDELLTEVLRKPLSHKACDYVRSPTGRERDDDAYRPRWIGLRPCDA